MKTNKIEPLKITIVTYVIAVVVAFAAISVSLATARDAHASELTEAHRFVGHPASEVLEVYGAPDGWAYFNTDTSSDLSQGVWYYDNIEFHLLYVDEVNSEGVICGVSER